MDGEVIKSFLVGLGYDVDAASLAKFNQSILSATKRVVSLGATIQATAAAIGYGISKVSQDFEQMGYEYHLIAPQINKALLLRRELLKAYAAAGINISRVVRESLRLNLSLTKTKFALEAIYKSVASRFFSYLTRQSETFRKKLYENMPKIQSALEKFVRFVFKALEATFTLGQRVWSILGRVYDFFLRLHEATDGWSTVILAVVAAWKLLNLSFLATPLGMLLSLGLALLTLYDDFKTFQEGGKSLINWKGFVPVVDLLDKSLTALGRALYAIYGAVQDVSLAFKNLFSGNFTAAWDSLKNAIAQVGESLKAVWEMLVGFNAATDKFDDWATKGLSGLFGQGNALPAVEAIQGQPGAGAGAVLGGQLANAQTNTSVQQQTNITITGVPDAQASAKAISGEQARVNFDLVRNLKGAVKPGGIQR